MAGNSLLTNARPRSHSLVAPLFLIWEEGARSNFCFYFSSGVFLKTNPVRGGSAPLSYGPAVKKKCADEQQSFPHAAGDRMKVTEVMFSNLDSSNLHRKVSYQQNTHKFE